MTTPLPPAQGPDPAKRARLRRLRTAATCAVALSATLFVAAQTSGSDAAWVHALAAFAGAATVGGLADWFAVAALFKHPLGLPIPHTRILPRSKDRIGSSLAAFVVDNFLDPKVVAAQLEQADLCARATSHLETHAPSLASKAAAAAPRILAALDDRDVARFLEEQAARHLRQTDLASLASSAISLLTSDRKSAGLTDDLLRGAGKIIEENRDLIAGVIRREIPLPDRVRLPPLGTDIPLGPVKEKLADFAADEVMKRLRRTLGEISANPEHPVRVRIAARLETFAADLKTSPTLRARADEFKRDLLDNPHLPQYAASVWNEMKAALLEDASRPDSALRSRIESTIRHLAREIQNDAPLRAKIDSALRRSTSALLDEHRPQIREMIESTVRRWDAELLVQKLELEVGADLQFVRLNGTLVGGLIGLALHLLTRL